MSDRELLEQAAMADGRDLSKWVYRLGSFWLYDGRQKAWVDRWNPLAKDGDALRLLAVCSLRLGIDKANKTGWVEDYEGINYRGISWSGIDPMPAIRRAIVCAAAAIVAAQEQAGKEAP